MTRMKLFLLCALAGICGTSLAAPLASAADPDSTAQAQAPTVPSTPDTGAVRNAAPAQVAPATPQTQAAQAEPSDRDGGWPRLTETVTGATLIMYQPQVVTWERQRELVAMAALSYLPKNATKPDLGTLRFSAQTSVSTEERMVKMEQVKVVDMSFPTLDKAEAREALAEIQEAVPVTAVFIGLDRVLAMVEKSQIRGSSIQVKTDPPPIHYSEKPAILLQFDGPPIMATLEKGTLKYVLNTNWDVLQDPASKMYYVRNEKGWLQAEDLKGPWKATGKLPKSFEEIPANDNWKDVKDNIPGKKGKNVVVFYSEQPAELLLLDGKPKYEKIKGTEKAGKKGTELLWVMNTESDLFRVKDADFYYLVSGRWFSAPKLEGPWKFATADLPPEFANIPVEHERANVRSSIPGTDEAAEAVLLAQVPQTARVDAKNLKPVDVAYDGEPKFEAVQGAAGVSYAINTESDVFIVDGKYYLCQAGVWFMSDTANGPWKPTANVPEAIYQIPPSSSAHHVTYVTVVDDDEDYPTYGYSAGYMGVSIAFGCAMWGTGYYYPPYYGYPGGGYPIYYPRPVCYGGGAMYNPRTGAYGHYQTAYGPYGGVARGASYNPKTGTYKRGAMAYGPGGAQGYAQAYNPRTGTYASTRQGSNAYGSWGSSSVQRGDDWVNTQRVTDSQGNSKWAAQGSGGGSAKGIRTDQGGAFVGQKDGDIYAGRDGNVYRKTDSGWQSWDNGNWNSAGGERPGNQPAGGAGVGNRPSTQPSGGAATRPSTQPSGGAGTRPSTQPATRPSSGSNTMGQLDRDAYNRNQGAQRSRSSSSGDSYSRGGGSRGGGSRGGGGRGGGRR